MVLINPSWQGYPLSANSKSKFMMSANFVSNSANLSSLSKSGQQFSKSVICKQIMSAIQQICLSYADIYDNQFCQQFNKSAILLVTKQIVILLSKSCLQFSKSVSHKQIVSAVLSCKQILVQMSAA
jgi:hypothetical protein